MGVADFNGDTKADLVWRNSVRRGTQVWYMNGATFLSGALLPSMTDLNWTIVGVADFNGNTEPDLVCAIAYRPERGRDRYINGLTLSQGASSPPSAIVTRQIAGTK